MKNQKTVQVFAKIGRILSEIVFICSLVAGCICTVGLICLPFGSGTVLKLGGVTLYGLLGADADVGSAAVGATLGAALLVTVGEAVLAKFAERYFVRELKAGTPFTLQGAKELLRLGILCLAIPTGCTVLATVLREVLQQLSQTAQAELDVSFGFEGSAAFGVMFIVGYFLCRYGAELEARTHEE